MSDSSWQQAVLRELGVARRGFRTLDATPDGTAREARGAEVPPGPASEQRPEPPVAEPVPAPVPAPATAERAGAQERATAPPFTPAAGPMPGTPGRTPAPEPAPLIPQPQAADRNAVAQQATAPRPAPEHAAPQPVPWHGGPAQHDAEQRTAAQPAPAPPEPALPAAEPPAPASPPPAFPVPEPAAPEPPAPEPPAPEQSAVQSPHPQAPPVADAPAPPAQADSLIESDFDWESAVNPVLGAVSHTEDTERRDAGNAAAAPAQPAAPDRQTDGQPMPAVDLVRRSRHGDPLARRMGRGVRNAMGGGGREARDRAAFAELMQRPVPSSRRIAIASVRGGAGKTTMAALVATELARHRADRVLAADADAELGSLPLRLGVRPQLSLFDLAAQPPRTFEEAERFLTRTPHGLYVLSSTRGGRIAGEFTLDTFQTALSAVSRYVAATVVDCGAGILTEVNRGVIAGSHGLVLVTPGTVDGALSARGALEWFAANNQQELLPRSIIAMVSHAPQVDADLRRAHEMLTAWGLPVVFVPYDRQLATGGPVDVDRVSAAARTA
ncbi:MinD/ParA family ATP-binding protein [Spirillospora albida]|uniref:MinD/ParA family ATP-binding protein n=1 Tax=Spirillospora albida TaxID=58123 RepID=UPI000AFF3789|nr:MinD/ParA family protein [Spirillospora albida]